MHTKQINQGWQTQVSIVLVWVEALAHVLSVPSSWASTRGCESSSLDKCRSATLVGPTLTYGSYGHPKVWVPDGSSPREPSGLFSMVVPRHPKAIECSKAELFHPNDVVDPKKRVARRWSLQGHCNNVAAPKDSSGVDWAPKTSSGEPPKKNIPWS